MALNRSLASICDSATVELKAEALPMADHDSQTVQDDNSSRERVITIAQHGGAAFCALAIVVAMSHWFGVSLT